jgi:hypothetical protein
MCMACLDEASAELLDAWVGVIKLRVIIRSRTNPCDFEIRPWHTPEVLTIEEAGGYEHDCMSDEVCIKVHNRQDYDWYNQAVSFLQYRDTDTGEWTDLRWVQRNITLDEPDSSPGICQCGEVIDTNEDECTDCRFERVGERLEIATRGHMPAAKRAVARVVENRR